jgi:DNA-binding IclR family transcriptional regulator
MRALRNGPNSYITVAMGERHGHDVVYMAVQPSREDVALSMRIGSRLPLFHSAIGRAILVGMDDSERQEAFADARRFDPGGDVARNRALEKAQQEFRTLGYCTGYGEWRPDVNGIAVPVRSLDGARIFGLNVGGPSFHVKKRQLEGVYARLLTEAAQKLATGE